MTIICTRHGVPGTEDVELLELARALAQSDSEAIAELGSLHDYEGQLWATWSSDGARDRFGSALSELWRQRHPDGKALNLSPSEEAYDFQEDVINNADPD